MQIELANIQDAPVILALQKLAFQSEAAINNDYTLPPLTQSLAELEADFQKHVILKAVLDGKIVGAVRGQCPAATCFIARLMVHPECQNRGLGARLMDAIEKHFSQAQRYALFTGEKSARNLYLYQKLGYQIVRTERPEGSVPIVYLEKCAAQR